MTGRRPFLHHRFRLRLTIAFVLVAALSSAALALTAYLLISAEREDRVAEVVEREARLSLALLGERPTRELLREAIEDFAAEPRLAAVADTPQGSMVAGDVTVDDVPADLREATRLEDFPRRSLLIDGRPYTAVGARIPQLDANVFYLFDRTVLEREMMTLRVTLLGMWVLIVVLTCLVGRAIARRVLWPVAEGARAARRVAEGLLDTRLDTGDGGDEFTEWAQAFNTMTAALQQKIEALTALTHREQRFTADVAHELRTPVSAAVNAAGLLEFHRAELSEEGQRAIDLVVADVRRLRRLVEDLLEISRLGAGREIVQREDVWLRRLVERLVQARGWERDVGVTGEDVELVSDRRRLERIIGNLVDNAVRHGGGSATVTTGTAQGEVFVAVVDTGQGVPVDEVPHLFEPFHKLDPARGGGGSGLGLTIAAQHARLLGGGIDVESRPGTGACFRLCLPAEPPAGATAAP